MMTRLRTDLIMGPRSYYPPHNEIYKAYAALLDVGDRGVDLEGLGDCLAALGAQLVVPDAAKGTP